jgi:carboxyl-terminal processing protease
MMLAERCHQGIIKMDEKQNNPAEPKPSKKMPRFVLGVLVVSTVFMVGFLVGNSADLGVPSANRLLETTSLRVPLLPGGNDQPDDEVDMRVFWEVWNALEERYYYDLPDEQTRVYGAIDGLIGTLDDPHTAFVPPDVAQILREDDTGSFEGIGAYVDQAPDGGVYIIRVFENGPAEAAGLRANDVIIAVEGQDVTDKTLNESLLLIRGPAGSTIQLTVLREGEEEPLTVDVMRARLEIPTIESRMLEDNIGYVALFEFNTRASERLEGAVRDLLDQGAESIILDLRNNPGGFLNEAILVSDLFLPKGTVVIQRDVEGFETVHQSRNGQIAEDVPLVVLVNEGSASASEIVAGAVQDRGRGTLIGTTTFGKGSVQLQFDLSDGSQLRVTYANWFTPNDRSIQGEGITPDIAVENPEEPSQEDLQLDRAIQFLETGQ